MKRSLFSKTGARLCRVLVTAPQFHVVARFFVLALAALWPSAGNAKPVATPEAKMLVSDRDTLTIELETLQLLVREGKYSQAKAGARGLLAKAEADSGPDSLEVAQVLDVLVEAMWRAERANLPQKVPPAQRALAIWERAIGPDTLDLRMVPALNNLATLHYLSGKFADAHSLYVRTLAIREGILGLKHPDVAKSLLNISNVKAGEGHLLASKELLERCLAIKEAALGPDHPDLIPALNNYGNRLRGIGNYDEARQVLDRALSMREKASRPNHPELAKSYENLAIVLFLQGEYAEARRLFERTREVQQASGEWEEDNPETLFNIASAEGALGDNQRARLLGERALEILRRRGGSDQSVATALSDLAVFRAALYDTVGARRLHEEALAMRVRVLGPDGAQVAENLDGLGRVHWKTNNWAAAESCFAGAFRIRRNALGADHPEVAATLNNIGIGNNRRQQYEEACHNYRLAIAILDKKQLSTHPLAARIANNLAVALSQSGRTDEAYEQALRAETVAREHVLLVGRALSEREMLRYDDIRTSGLSLAISIAASRGPRDNRTTRTAWDAVIRSRAIVLDEMVARRRATIDVVDPEVVHLNQSLVAARERLANISHRTLSELAEPALQEVLTESRRQKDVAERALAERSTSFRYNQLRHEIGFDDIARALPERTGLVAYVSSSSPLRSSTVDMANAIDAERVPRYFAFVLRARDAAPELITLGTVEQIDNLVERWRDEISRPPQGLRPARLTAEISYCSAAESLRHAVWDPVMVHVRGTKQVFVVPDGSLNLLNMATLPTGDGHYLLETGPLFHHLSAERDLVAVSEAASAGHGLLVLANPDFEKQSFGTPQPSPDAVVASTSASRSRRASCAEFRERRFEALHQAQEEGEEVLQMWHRRRGNAARDSTVIRLSGAFATETAFKLCAPGRRIVHLATHGFFLPAGCVADTHSSRGAPRTSGSEYNSDWVLDSPLVLSGLVLAGANARAEPTILKDDGILTAEEVVSIDLRGVEWAVLSACDTGRGTVKTGEGVLGLRRAFQMAGARTIVMSLWPVEEEATRAWMVRLYENRLRGRSTAEAVHAANRACLKLGRQSGYSHPFYWGAFVAVGDWR